MVDPSQNFLQSVYRERLLEHLLVGELLKHSWLRHGAELEVSAPAIDRAGHDIVLEANGVVRHVQLKASALGAATRSQAIHLHLSKKPSGCVVWTRFDPTDLRLDHFMFFGNLPGSPLPSLEDFEVAKHSKGDSTGVKKERQNLRVVPASKFQRLVTVTSLYEALFGPKEPALRATSPHC